jgi:Zn-dependent protease
MLQYLFSKNASLEVARVMKIPVRLHFSFGLLFLYLGYTAWSSDVSREAILLHLAFVFCIYVCIFLHELSHALMAAFFGVKTNEIFLFPFGGAAVFERQRVKAMQEFMIAFAGPLANLSIAALLYISIKILTPSNVSYIGVENQLFDYGNTFFERLLWLNVVIALFNLLPAFPLDGGLMLRALLCNFMAFRKAVRIQFFISIFIGTLILAYSYVQRAPEYLLFAWLIYFSSRKEWKSRFF